VCVCARKTFASVDSLLRKLSLGVEPRGQQHLTWEQFLAFFSCAANRPDINEVYDRYVHFVEMHDNEKYSVNTRV